MTDPAGQQQVRPGLLIALGVVAGLGALAALWVFVVQPLLEPDQVAQPPPDVDVDVDVTVEPTPSPTATGEVVPDDDVPIVTDDDLFTDEPFPETFEIFTARDPFQQLVQVVEAPSPAAPGTGAPPAPTQPTPAPSPQPTTPGAPQPTELPDTNGDDAADDDGAPPTPVQPNGGQPGTMQPSGNGTSTTQVGQTEIHLVDVFVEDGEPMVLVEVNGEVHEAGEGEVFAGRFQVLDIAGDCATFLFGDSRFMLCEGEQILK